MLPSTVGNSWKHWLYIQYNASWFHPVMLLKSKAWLYSWAYPTASATSSGNTDQVAWMAGLW
ncbi:hypothetical protein KMC56_gp38 [Achromobacter phage vB_AxyP_19-32_Axy12]|uniref:Uncharacterized protein n=1 Tax=Achromobacter phage vB_AxyP_19-32_Axy12 TaxID=2591043 RepID=A0A514CUK6_9CAUD|nr:hypothetical protein KMC56_gp38 [Achromobacter phage vB_AxyP_19-32_Axy12]QDH84151.1 hypothetical protein Axy12_081 [Achromobacter phage vB_AxyP_19-32_Axy12]